MFALGVHTFARILVLHILILSSNGAKQILCNNAGLQWAAFNNPIGQPYSDYDPNFMKDTSIPGGKGTANLLYNNVTTKVGGFTTSCQSNFSAYNSPSVIPCSNHSMMFRGYLNPSISGMYSFTFHAINWIAFLWVGSAARSGWNRQNHVLESTYNKPWLGQSNSYGGNNATLIRLTAGNYYPIRIINADANTVFWYYFSIVDPYGNTILGANTGPSANVVQYSCDGSAGPTWSDWGKEA